MPWFPDFIGAAELARRQTRAAGQADPVAQYITALNKGDIHVGRNDHQEGSARMVACGRDRELRGG
jgi:hypothetical protein